MTVMNTPRAMRPVIALVGCRNAGKSSLLNALCGEEVSIVSEEAGTTTDAVAKAYELLPLGPVTFYDTAGLDDISALGQQRIKASKRVLAKSDLALLVVGEKGLSDFDKKIADELQQMNTPTIVVFNKSDLSAVSKKDVDFCQDKKLHFVCVSAQTKESLDALKSLIVQSVPEETKRQTPLLGDIINPKDCVVLVAPIDESAPKNRLILPQVQVLRELLDLNASAFVCQPEELKETLQALKNPPRLVVCDSQAVLITSQIVPENVPLTTFSILFARFKGDLRLLFEGSQKIDALKDGSKILIAEACSHHTQGDDIAKVKIPNLLKKFTQKDLEFSFCTGGDFPDDLSSYDLVIHCGGCMINQKEMLARLQKCSANHTCVTNYGVAISKAQGVLDRVIAPFQN